MNIKIDVKGIKEMTKKLDDLAKKQIPFATAKALTNIGQEIKKELKKEMEKSFDRPTPYTLNSLQLTPARKDKLESKVWLKNFAGKGTPATKYLAPQIFGGERNLKRSEKALQLKGVMPKGMGWVPGKAARLNQYGNISGGQITQILSKLKALSEVGYLGNITKKSLKANKKPRDYFAGAPKNLPYPAGVWERTKTKIRPILIFIQKPIYKKRFNFFEIANKVFHKEWVNKFKEALDYAIKTSK